MKVLFETAAFRLLVAYVLRCIFQGFSYGIGRIARIINVGVRSEAPPIFEYFYELCGGMEYPQTQHSLTNVDRPFGATSNHLSAVSKLHCAGVNVSWQMRAQVCI